VSFTKQRVLVCPSCKEEMGYIPFNTSINASSVLEVKETCPMEDCGRVLVERHRWICSSCGESYPGNRKAPEYCDVCWPEFPPEGYKP
jgi:hypothetical protein